MSRPPHLPWFNHPNIIRWRKHVVQFIIMQFSPRSVFLPLGPYILLNTPFSKTLVCVPSSKWKTSFRTPTIQLAKLQFCIF
jgi:hypothetical protein